MVTKTQLKQIILEQHDIVRQKMVPRRIDPLWLECEEVIVLSGVRRCGKSVLLQQIRQKCTESDYSFNFEDERLIHFSVEDFQTLHECMVELYGVQRTWFFDEIQNIVGWERFVRRLFNAGHKIYVTGSNANMLSRELGTHLTGRCIQVELFPFSFQEFLQLRKFNWDEASLMKTETSSILQTQFMEYMRLGGFPAYLKNQSNDYLVSLYQNILYRDVMQRNHLDSEREILQLMNYLASNGAKSHSFASLGKICGIRHPDTIKNYLKYIEDTYLLNVVYRYSPSLKAQMASPKKVYLVDNALMTHIGFNATHNIGPLLENLVYLELRRRGCQIYYHSEKTECDFLVHRGFKVTEAYQVSVSIADENTHKREICGLLEAAQLYNTERQVILTLSEEASFVEEGVKIDVIPVWKWLLGYT